MKFLKHLLTAATLIMAGTAGAVDITNVYVVGSAVQSEWNLGQAVAMTKSGNTYTYTGVLTAGGEFKLITTTSDNTELNYGNYTFFAQASNASGDVTIAASGYTGDAYLYQNGTYEVDETADDGTTTTVTKSNDNKWAIDDTADTAEENATGLYTITLTVADDATAEPSTITVTPVNIYIVGGAVPNVGWVDTKAIKLTHNGNTYTYRGILDAVVEGQENTGDFKFMTAQNFTSASFHATSANQPISIDGIENEPVLFGGDDNKWQILESAYYVVTLTFDGNLTEDSGCTISVAPPTVYMMGDATPNGWVPYQPEPMSRDGLTYTYTAFLNKGEFKFLSSRKYEDPCFFAQQNTAALTKDGYTNQTVEFREQEDVAEGQNGDNKWTVQDPGVYAVTLKMAADPTSADGGTLTIKFLSQTDIADSVVENADDDELYTLQGRRISRANASAGIYIVRKDGKAYKVAIR